MKRIIYTGAYDIGWGPYKGIQPWQSCAFELHKRYAQKCNADLEIIDNYSGFDNIFKSLVSSSGNNAWAIGTLAGIYAINHFFNSPYDEFLWMDLDFICIKFEDLFEYASPSIYYKEFDWGHTFIDWLDNEKIKLAYQYSNGCPHFNQTSSGKYRLDKIEAEKILCFLDEIGWNPINSKVFAAKIKDAFTPTEETLLNIYFGSYIPNKMFIEPFYLPYERYDHNFIHFASKTKVFLPEYVQENPVNY